MAAARNVEIVLTIDDRGTAQIKRLRRTTETEAAKMKRAAEQNFRAMQQSLTGNLDAMTNRFLRFAKFGVGIFGTLAAGAVVKFGSSFQKTMSGVKAVSQATEREMEQLTNQARQLGATTQFTAVQAAQAMEELGKAGFKTTEILGTMPDVLNLAAAGELEMAEAASIASDVIRIMGLDVTEFRDATDIMAQTAVNAKTTIQELGFAYQDAAPVARSLGIGFKDLNLLMGVLANRGFVATRSGTALRRIFSVFLGDLEEGEKGLSAYNVQLQRNEDGTVDLIRTFQGLVDAGLDANEVMEAFGLRGGPAALNIISSLGLEVEGLAGKLDEFSGAAGRVATERLDNLAGDGKILVSTMQELALVFFDQISPGLRTIAQGATDVFREWQKLVKASDVVAGLETLWNLGKVAALAYGVAIGVGLVAKLGSFVVSAGTAIGSMLTMNTTMVASIPIIKAWTTATVAAKVAMGGVGLAVGVLAVVVGKALAELTGLGRAFDTAANRAEAAAVATQELADAVEKIGEEIKEIKSVTPEGGILEGVVGEIEGSVASAMEALDNLSTGSRAYYDLQESIFRDLATLRIKDQKGRELNERQTAAVFNEASRQAKEALLKMAEVHSSHLEGLRAEYEQYTAFTMEATDEQKRVFVEAWEEAGLVAEVETGKIGLAFAIMARMNKESAQEDAEAKRIAAEAAKELERQTDNLKDIFEAAGRASENMGAALAGEIVQAFKDVEATGNDSRVVIEAFGDRTLEMIDHLEQAGLRVPPVLYSLGAAAKNLRLEIEMMVQNLDDLTAPGGGYEEPFPDPASMGGGIPDEEEGATAWLTEWAQKKNDAFGPPETTLWEDFWVNLGDRADEFISRAGEGMAMFAANAITGFGNILGAWASGSQTLSEGFKQLGKQMISQMVAFLVQWGIQRLIAGRVIKAAQATETMQAMSSGLAQVWMNTFASVSLAPWPIGLTAAAEAMAAVQAAAGGVGLAAAEGAGLGATIGLASAGPWATGGLVRRHSIAEVGEGGQEEAIVPLRGGHADRVRKELFRGFEGGGQVTVVNHFHGDNWRDAGIDDDLGERIMESLDSLIRRGRGFAIATETA